MVRILFALAVVCVSGVAFAASAGAPLVVVPDRAAPETPRYIADAPPPALTAQSWGLYDLETGERIAAHRSDEVHPIASITKLLTAAVAADAFVAGATTTVSHTAVATEGRAGSLAAGETLSLSELLFPLLLESSNDAAEALAEARGRDIFLGSMNFAAITLGMTGSTFADPSGLSPRNVSSADDLALLLRHLATTAPQLLDITRLSRYVDEERMWSNVNPVVADDGFVGGKHGYTPEANRTLAALFTEPLGGQTRTLALVLLGSDDLRADVAALRAFATTHIHDE